jgi:putative DNA primase/helicase
VNNGSDHFTIDPHPDVDDLTLAQLREEYAKNEETFASAKQQGADEIFLAHRRNRRRILSNAIKAREHALHGVSSAPGVDKDDLPSLDAGDHDLARISELALSCLNEANDPPTIFRHADCVSRIRRADIAAMVIQPMSEDSLRGELARCAKWYRKINRNQLIPALPPMHVVRDILSLPSLPFPVLTRVVRSPIFAADGSLTTQAGYSPAAKIYYDPQPDFDVPTVPRHPDPDDVAFAKDQLNDILFDFPFVSETEKTHAIALVLQLFARELIDGSTPLFLIEKPSPGTGAGLLADILTTLFLGRAAAVMTEARDEDEWRKRITAKLMTDNTIILLDNIRRRLDSSALSAAITGGAWTDRILGRTADVQIPTRATWIATGNNPALSNEMARRTVRIRLDSKIDRPWLRDGFRYENLREYVTKERAKLVWCCLVIIRDWLVKGRPPGGKLLGTFESWSKVIGGIVENAGLTGFLGNIEELYEESDAEGKAWSAFVAAWWDAHGNASVGVSDLYKIVYPMDGEPLELDLGDKSEKSQKTKLGKLLVQMRDRQFNGKRIVRDGTLQRAQLWQLEDTGK